MTASVLEITRSEIDAEFYRIVDELTRRGFLTGGLGAAAALGFAGCSADDAHPSASASAATRLVDSVYGKIRVPADPKRIVSINQADTTSLYDFGITPVGIFDYGLSYTAPRYRKQYQAAAKIGSTAVDVEKVAALRPDLILGYDIEFNTKVYKQLTHVAPTVIVTASSWQAATHQIADAVNRSGVHKALQTKYKQRCATLRSQYAGQLATTKWDVLQGGFTTGSCWVFGKQSAVAGVLSDLGAQFASATGNLTGLYKPLSYENLGNLSDAGAIAYWSEYGSATPVNGGPQLFSQQLWKDLPAVKAGHLVPIADFSMSGYGGALAVLDQLEAGLKKLKETK